ncbi:MAG: hypothetical protein RMK31_06365 [Candidatus Caldarchaeum sp.]|nr:hypothetical protein [Candidatus Caldarchaeum sp.]
MNRKQLLILVLAAATLAGSAALTLEPSPFKLRPLKTFYVVAYFWGYVFYDETFNEIPYMVVNRGDEVVINLIPASVIIRDPGLSARERTYVEYENRTHRSGVGELPPRDPRITVELVKAHEDGYSDHGFFIEGYNKGTYTCSKCGGGHQVRNSLQQVLQEASAAMGVVRLVADKPGSYTVYCIIYCGYGHPYLRVENAFVVV